MPKNAPKISDGLMLLEIGQKTQIMPQNSDVCFGGASFQLFGAMRIMRHELKDSWSTSCGMSQGFGFHRKISFILKHSSAPMGILHPGRQDHLFHGHY